MGLSELRIVKPSTLIVVSVLYTLQMALWSSRSRAFA